MVERAISAGLWVRRDSSGAQDQPPAPPLCAAIAPCRACHACALVWRERLYMITDGTRHQCPAHLSSRRRHIRTMPSVAVGCSLLTVALIGLPVIPGWSAASSYTAPYRRVPVTCNVPSNL